MERSRAVGSAFLNVALLCGAAFCDSTFRPKAAAVHALMSGVAQLSPNRASTSSAREDTWAQSTVSVVWGRGQEVALSPEPSYSRSLTPPCGDWGPWDTTLGGAGPNSNRFTKLKDEKRRIMKSLNTSKTRFGSHKVPPALHLPNLSYWGGGLKLLALTSGPASKPEGLHGPAGSAGLLTDVS